MELNLKILAPLLQCTSKNRCALFMRAKKKIILITRLIKIMPLSLWTSLSSSLSHSGLSLYHSGLSLWSLTLSTPVSHFGLLLSQLRSPKPLIHPFCRPNSPTQAPSPKPKERCTGRAMRSKHNWKPKHGEDVDSVGSIDAGLILH